MVMNFRRRFPLGVKREHKITLRHFRVEISNVLKDIKEEKIVI
jgi:hypothetical protein